MSFDPSYRSSVYLTRGGQRKRSRGGPYKRRTRSRVPRHPPGGGLYGLDKAGREYARLLADPVSAPIVQPGMAGGQPGQIMRFTCEQSFINSTNTCGIVAWTPGLACVPLPGTVTAGLPYPFLIGAGTTSSVTLGAPAASGASGYVPGYSFITANATSYRCIAADLELIYAGSEQTRSGMVYLAHTVDNLSFVSGGIYDVNGTVGNVCQRTIRMPDGGVHLRFRPTLIDQEFTNTGPTSAGETPALSMVWNGAGSLLIGVTGVTAGQTVNLRCTAVYEFIPSSTLGITGASSQACSSKNPLHVIVDSLDKYAPGWATVLGEIGLGMAAAAFMKGGSTK